VTHELRCNLTFLWTSPMVYIYSIRITSSIRNWDRIIKTFSLCRGLIRCKLYRNLQKIYLADAHAVTDGRGDVSGPSFLQLSIQFKVN